MKKVSKAIATVLATAFLVALIPSCASNATYNVVFDLDEDVTLVVGGGKTIGESDIPAAPDKPGYTFRGWKLEDEIFDFTKPVTANVTLAPFYEANRYELTFNGADDKVYVYYDSEIGTLPAVPEKEGVKSSAWKVGKVTLSENFVWRFTENKVATASYNYYVALTSPASGAEVDPLPLVLKTYLGFGQDEDARAEFLYKYHNDGTFKAQYPASAATPVDLRWTSTEKGAFTVTIASDEDFENVVYTRDYTFKSSAASKSAAVYNLLPGSYYWKVGCESGKESSVGSFSVKGFLRPIYCGNIDNMRDLGGWTGEFGKIKYGLVYRSSELNGKNSNYANADAKKILVESLKIKTDLDVRLSDDHETESPDPSITLKNFGFAQQDYIFPNFNPARPFSSTSATGLKNCFKLFADESNYPIDFHCTAGADRTGTLAFLLSGLLGVSYENLAYDFEMTSFYRGRRWRTQILRDNGRYYFEPFDETKPTESGAMQDNASNLVAFDRMYHRVMTAYSTADGKLSSAIANYLKTVCEITDQEIENIRRIMIEGYGE